MRVAVTEQVFSEAIKRMAKTDDGRIVLSWLSHYCFHNGTALEKGSLENTYANAAVQNVYRALRGFVLPEDLRIIEYDYQIKKEEVNHERRSTNK